MKIESENKTLKKIISDVIRKKGKITFTEYMDMVLYHPVEGYYHSPKEKIGKVGDYYTSPHVHPVFGYLIARLIHKMWNIMNKRHDFTIIEAGAGKGFLCCDILDYIREYFPEFYNPLTYKIIEMGHSFSMFQRDLLKKKSHEDKVEWFQPDDFRNGIVHFNGCYLSNELLDAFPFNIVQVEEGALKEVYVTLNQDSFVEELGEPSIPALEEYFADLDVHLQEGQRAEVNLKINHWLEEINRAMGSGFIVTVDYGYSADELFASHRKNGTLSCYYRHTVNHNPYIRIGFQDITAHIDFTTIMRFGEQRGFRTSCYLEQYRFLIALGLLGMMEELEKNIYNMSTVEYYKKKLTMKNFMIPGGMGSIFKVLIQKKAIYDNQIENLFAKATHRCMS
ncbi:MAG: SAM-dependent methyltransferase [Thermodesulfobacteriota bacterium]|nr:SAM-dependent methyltransferase [Thermodesulfobacteriota bacterium]